ncbi:unnamed protein product, partial [Brachionus calyciflorus]
TTKTRIKTGFNTKFPTITVCNLNYFTSEYSINYIESLEYYKFEGNPFAKGFEYIAKANKPKNSSVLYGDSLKKLIVFCEYESNRCNMSQVKHYNHPEYGDCYTLNSGSDQKDNVVPL